ncbi:hypothetical protein QMA69_13020 [Burkholderia pseudomallei]|nr:hypothetical protein [Burkholderia pseudomallei]MDN7671031.1 hypothetical protein [Burkholderia oklahomensis]MEB5485846.1 hypothetical protein [Burkholderia pseudomallei]MEB5493635.1 hypothetical protein [Burkholderia pseudomallei]MEB5499257.1 hypothetical protein [Burkholderia pseudomallei]MEB5504264.1 hypothetical protein [Burkholderia pseudomallei]
MAKKKKRVREPTNVGILSWRASDKPSPAKSLNPLRKPSTEQQRRQTVETQTLLVNSIFRCDLRPSPAQKAILDSLFSGPLLLRTLLLKAAHKPQTPHEASMFLLENHKELQPYLIAGNRSESVDLLKNLILQWASRIPTLIELQFTGDCSVTPSNQVFLPIPQLGAVPVQNESRLIEARYRSHYKPTFALVHSTLGYLIEIVFVRREILPLAAPGVREPEKPTTKKASRTEPASARLDVGRFVTLFGALDRARANETRVARNFVKPDFGALEGRAVQGGLPSLGKRRK